METKSPTENSLEGLSNDKELVRDGDNVSHIERLPKELLFDLIEYFPERVFDLRLVRRTFTYKQ